jgi:hypothetical protein
MNVGTQTHVRVLSKPRSRTSPILGIALAMGVSVILWTVCFLVYEWLT